MLGLTCLHSKTHAMILVCAVDYFENISKLAFYFTKNHKKSVISINSGAWCSFKSARRVENHLNFSWKNTSTENPFLLQKFDFCIFEPKNSEVIKNYSKATLNLGLLKCTCLGIHSFQYYKRQVRKNEIDKWPFITSFQCI